MADKQEKITSYFSGIENKPILLNKIVSGGQTGADRAALEAAKECGFETGGWAPVGYQTSSGRDQSLKSYGLKEDTNNTNINQSYIWRSKKNIDDSCATLFFRIMESNGTDCSISYCYCKKWQPEMPNICRFCHKDYLVIRDAVLSDDEMGNMVWETDIDRVILFLRMNKIHTLNVAGHREFMADGMWQKRVFNFMADLLQRVKKIQNECTQRHGPGK